MMNRSLKLLFVFAIIFSGIISILVCLLYSQLIDLKSPDFLPNSLSSGMAKYIAGIILIPIILFSVFVHYLYRKSDNFKLKAFSITILVSMLYSIAISIIVIIFLYKQFELELLYCFIIAPSLSAGIVLVDTLQRKKKYWFDKIK